VSKQSFCERNVRFSRYTVTTRKVKPVGDISGCQLFLMLPFYLRERADNMLASSAQKDEAITLL
jgi:hypothetical protein